VVNEIKKKKPPGTVKEILEFEMQTGRMFKSSKHLFEERKSLSDDKPPSLDGIM
jgi:hypothetical protein